MTAQRPDPPRSQQVNTHGGTGFQDGNHVHIYGGGYPAGAATVASLQATSDGTRRGQPIGEWAPFDLGVHPSITIHDEDTLTPYLARPHDQQLREMLAQAKESDRPSLIVVVGTSCTGKTRSLYEAVLDTLPTWPIAAPNNDSGLAKLLLDGIPANTIVWLDELQDQLTITPDGITAAKAITELLDADVGPILVAGTIWPTNHATMRARPEPAAAPAGAGAIPTLLTHATVITVPNTFTEADLEKPVVNDPRLQLAIRAATQTTRPDHGRKITQLLAGGAQLVNRLYPPDGTHPPDEFSPAAKALLHAAADLRRIGMPNPLPRWAIDGAAPGYLNPPDHRPPDHWLPVAIDEATHAARHDDPLTGAISHD